MTTKPRSRPAPRALRRLAMVLLTGAALPTSACELDGLSHGYGPMSALFAGAHRYQSLNGVEEDEAPPAEPPTVDAPAPAAARTTASGGASPPTPPRSFVAWAKAKPKVAGASEAPASWVPGSADASRAVPQGAEPEQRKDGQRPPSGGPVP